MIEVVSVRLAEILEELCWKIDAKGLLGFLTFEDERVIISREICCAEEQEAISEKFSQREGH